MTLINHYLPFYIYIYFFLSSSLTHLWPFHLLFFIYLDTLLLSYMHHPLWSDKCRLSVSSLVGEVKEIDFDHKNELQILIWDRSVLFETLLVCLVCDYRLVIVWESVWEHCDRVSLGSKEKQRWRNTCRRWEEKKLSVSCTSKQVFDRGYYMKRKLTSC